MRKGEWDCEVEGERGLLGLWRWVEVGGDNAGHMTESELGLKRRGGGGLSIKYLGSWVWLRFVLEEKLVNRPCYVNQLSRYGNDYQIRSRARAPFSLHIPTTPCTTGGGTDSLQIRRGGRYSALSLISRN